jgi:predicted nucleic acid-binding protein
MGTINRGTIAVFDAGPIIHLDELDCLDLLTDFRECFIPERVKSEIARHRSTALEKIETSSMTMQNKLPKGKILRTMCKVFSLDAGEIEALAVIEQIPQAILFTDDASARLVADKMGFRVHGTIGIIIRAIRKNKRHLSRLLKFLEIFPCKVRCL